MANMTLLSPAELPCPMDTEEASCVRAVVGEAMAPLLARCTAAEGERILAIAAHLERLDGFAVIADLDSPSRTQYDFGFNVLPTLLAATIGADAVRSAGFHLAGREALLGAVRHRANAARPFRNLYSSARWLVPAAAEDRAMLHVAALALTRNGASHRPWTWGGLPDHGDFSLLGRAAPHMPAASHKRCMRVVMVEDLLPAVIAPMKRGTAA